MMMSNFCIEGQAVASSPVKSDDNCEVIFMSYGRYRTQ